MFAIILGTRPEIIKMSPIIRSCEKRGIDYFVLHTGQHYSYEMDKVFFEISGFPIPGITLMSNPEATRNRLVPLWQELRKSS